MRRPVKEYLSLHTHFFLSTPHLCAETKAITDDVLITFAFYPLRTYVRRRPALLRNNGFVPFLSTPHLCAETRLKWCEDEIKKLFLSTPHLCAETYVIGLGCKAAHFLSTPHLCAETYWKCRAGSVVYAFYPLRTYGRRHQIVRVIIDGLHFLSTPHLCAETAKRANIFDLSRIYFVDYPQSLALRIITWPIR